jgi:hypothetical protein
MPLYVCPPLHRPTALTPSSHLLGKKSWNVYNADNIAKVKRDEAEAKTKDEAEEQRMQEVDAERRLQILRGPHVPSPPPPPRVTHDYDKERPAGSGRERKRRKLAGEDDTDRDIRLANALVPSTAEKPITRKSTSNVPLTDVQGHINLFPVQTSQAGSKNAEAEAEKAKKKKEYEDQYTMRFSNAAGFKESLGKGPWYAGGAKQTADESVGKDVWGNEDKGRREREKRRMTGDDPLLAVRRGVNRLKEVELKRKRIDDERQKEIERMIREESRREKRRRIREQDCDELEGFSLDAPGPDKARKERRSHHSRHESERQGKERHRRHRRSVDDREDNKLDNRPSRDRHRGHWSGIPRDKGQETLAWSVGAGGRYSNQYAT